MTQPGDLVELLTLERLDRDLFRAHNADHGQRPTIYGGQVAAQALAAAGATVDAERVPHSFHGYFLRPGDPAVPVILRVDRDRDGGSFSARRVVAVQAGEVIFSMLSSFHAERTGGVADVEPTRAVPDPEALVENMPDPFVDRREVTPTDYGAGLFTDCIWVRSAVPLGDDPLLHACALTYASDFGSGFGQGGYPGVGRGGASIDHAMWFQGAARADDWVLLDMRPSAAWAGRGVYHGTMRRRDGVLAATLHQEGLMIWGAD